MQEHYSPRDIEPAVQARWEKNQIFKARTIGIGVYNTEEALAAHGQSAHFKELAGTLKTTLAGPLEIERLTVKF